MKASFKNYCYLLKADLRQNKGKHLIWLVLLVGTFALFAVKFNDLYSTPADMAAIAQTLKLPAIVSLYGEFYAKAPYSGANIFTTEMLVFMGMFIVFMNISLAISNTRAEEDSGLLEMVRSRQVGRLSAVMATAWEIVLINGFMGMLCAGSLALARLQGTDLQGNLLFGASLASIGVMFGFISLLVAQMASDARSAYFISFGLYLFFYLLRMLTDVSDPEWTWLVPIGWLQKTKIYVENNWIPCIMMLVFGSLMLFISLGMASVRDMGRGILPTREGKGRANRWLKSPLLLIFRVARNRLFGWCVGGLVLGVADGSTFSTIGDIIGTNPTYKKMLGLTEIQQANQELILDYLSLLGTMFAIVAAISGIVVVNGLQSDENKGYLEMVHARGISRIRLVMSYYSIAVLESVGVFSLTVYGTFLSGNHTLKQPIMMKYFWQMLLAYLPVVLFFLGLSLVVVGIFQRLTRLLWIYVVLSFLAKLFVPLLNVSDAFMNISPLGWVGKVPKEAVCSSWVLALCGIFLVLSVFGLIGYTKRDLS